MLGTWQWWARWPPSARPSWTHPTRSSARPGSRAEQQHGTVNADGFGVGWYAPGDPRPARYRRTGPMWADPSFADLARVVHTGALLAAVRDATVPSADGEAAAAPFADGPWLFSHNGAVPGYPESVLPLASQVPSRGAASDGGAVRRRVPLGAAGAPAAPGRAGGADAGRHGEGRGRRGPPAPG
ncbi:hypothetical protein GCM10020000_10990 [Streptomyces olivoverticillatus]